MSYMKSRLLVFLFLLCFNCHLSGSNNYLFRHLDIVDGMSDNHIRGLSTTPDGRLAVRTASILNLYDGAGFEHFYHDKRKEYKWDYWGVTKEYHDAQSRIWMKERDYLLLLDLKTNRFVYDIEGELKSMGISKRINNLFIDDSKNIWFLTEDKTLSYYDSSESKLIVVAEGGDKDFIDKYGIPKEMAQYKNICWIIYSNGLIRCWDYTSKEFIFQDNYFCHKINDATDRISIHTTSSGDLWLMYNHGVYHYNKTERIWTEKATISGGSNFFTCMNIDLEGNVWLGTSWSGLRVIHTQTGEVEVIPGMKLEQGGTVVNDIYSIHVDREGGIWIGTLFQGIYYYHPNMRLFHLANTVENETLLTNETVRCFIEEQDGSILVGTAKGIVRFYPETRKMERVYPELENELCLSLYRDKKNRLWVSTFIGGFYCIDGRSVKNYRRYKREQDLVYNTSRDIYEDPSGRYWVSVIGGVGEFFPQTGEISMLYEKHPKVAFHKVDYKIYPIDDESFAVVGESGIYYYSTVKDSLWIPEIDNPENAKFQDLAVMYFCICKDSRALEWYGTPAGIKVWDTAANKLYNISVEDGLSNNTVVAILEDANGIIWASSVSGVSKIEVAGEPEERTFSITNYGVSDGLQSGKFYDRSALKASNGLLYFGGVHGFNYFDPQKTEVNKTIRTPLFTSFSLFNTVIKEGAKYNKRVILDMPINRTTEIVLRHNENFITLGFSGLNYINPTHTYFKYRLEGFDKSWTEIPTKGEGKVTYTGLRPDKYKLIVYTSNDGKTWDGIPAQLSIVIQPPFWATNYAITLYILLLVGSIVCLFRFVMRKNELKLKEQQISNERNQKEELNQMKFRFFTNISHEFRTPLTLIITPLEILIREEPDPVRKNKLSLIYRSANDLLMLVNQLLDFRKLEMKGEGLNLSKGDIVRFVEEVCMQFKDIILSRNIDFSFDNRADSLVVCFDRSKLHKVINNLLSNALKFTPDGGHLSVIIEQATENGREFIKISISDTGCGINEEDQRKIFDRFYQGGGNENQYAGSGSGIGLHLVKEYVDLHDGKISVTSRPDDGSTFSVYIPIDLHGGDLPVKSEPGEEPVIPLSDNNKRKTILIAEDNADFRRFLVEQLSLEYHVLEAEDGEEGRKLAFSHSPDLIISDLMMPKIDGIMLCDAIKTNIQTSHIPFILLTARISDEAKMDGYEAGADSYIAKPFNFDILAVRIKKLIEQQEKRQELFHKMIEVTPSTITVNSLDEKFIQKVLQYIEKNMDNWEYTMEDLSVDVGMNRSHLYRKIRSITGQTATDFVRSVRLKRAAQYLIKTQYNVSQIADLVGFGTMKYFNKYFKDEFKMTPSQFRAQHKSHPSDEL